VAWEADGHGFFYTRYPEPGTVPPGEEEYHSHVFHHVIGDDPARDPKVFGEGRSPQDMMEVQTSHDGRWLVVIANQGWTRSDVYLCDLSQPERNFRPIVEGVDALFGAAIPTANRIYLLTNWEATNYRVVAVDPVDPALERWETVVPERADRVIQAYALAGGRIVTHDLERATSRLRSHALDGTTSQDLPLPGLGSIGAIDGEQDGSLVVASFESFAMPSSGFVFDLDTGERTQLAALPLPAGLEAGAIDVDQVSYHSKDGTPVSMFVIHRRGLERNGDHPLLLTGYGGFNISISPYYSARFLAWIERGGVVAIPNLRGGGEYGEEWHRAGMLQHKQNVFDDFIAAAEWLIGERYTRAERLAIDGGSNGGLLVGAALTQRPDLFRAVVCAVPLLDMLRYHHFRIAKLWIPEYGSADDPEAFRWLYAYSPYHHVVPGTCYPATLLKTGEEDSRVDPMHARKMAALLQWATSCGNEHPILLRAETKAGHGAGKPLSKRVAEAADDLSFIGWQLDVGRDQ
jgi:prolyl oligopeptidase